jgi:hypothetical protein
VIATRRPSKEGERERESHDKRKNARRRRRAYDESLDAGDGRLGHGLVQGRVTGVVLLVGVGSGLEEELQGFFIHPNKKESLGHASHILKRRTN